MSKRPRPLIAAVILAVSTAAMADNPYPAEWFWGDSEQRAKQDAMIGRPAPPLDKLSHWMNGELKPGDLKGKIVVVDFWATWCGPCVRSIPHNTEMAAKYAEQGVIILGVCGSPQGQETMQAVLEEKKATYPAARDATTKLAKAWNVMWWPTYGVIDRRGNLRALGLQPDYVENVVDSLLAEQPATGSSAADDVPQEWLEGNAEKRTRLDPLYAAAEPPALQVTDWMNGEPATLADLKGKVVVLDFWATWCGSCLASIPHTNELQAKYAGQGLVILGVCHSEGAEKLQQVVEERGIKYPVAKDIAMQTKKAYLVNGFPDYYLIDRQGRLRIADCRNEKIEDAIKVLLAEPQESEAEEGAQQAAQ